MNEKVLCPYCGNEMELEHYGIGDDESFVYGCPDCAAQSPISYSAESALATALSRPLQKPLTLEEAKKNPIVIYFEHKSFSNLNRYGVRIMGKKQYQMQDGSIIPLLSKYIKNNSLYIGKFGLDWRCWATKPTDEEREAAKWDD